MKKRLTRITAITIPLFLLSACGDEVTEQIYTNVGAVETSNDLPECTKDIAGQTAFVAETHEFLGCDGKEWQTLSANTVSVGDNVCTSTSLSDGTGFEIFCNGESIGTVKNGKDGTDGKDGANGKDGEPGAAGKDGADGQKGDKGDTGAKGDKGDDGAPGTNGTNGTNGAGCKIQESTALTATIACGSETFTMDLTGYVDVPEECDPSDEGCAVEMDDVELSGVSQKGPFVSGTDVTAYELENGKSLKQTGKTFGGKIENKDGSFNIRTVKLKSSFAYLVADGFYRNEVTGKNSIATIKLRALTNLDGRSTANINLVTHLEYDRVQRLVTKENKSVIEAKRAAENALFAAFNIDNAGFKGFAEDLNIFKEGDGNAALLAVSAMLQGDRDESQLTALLASFSVDLGDNGVWDDSLQRAQIADWAMKADIEGRLATIRANVEGWKLSDSKAPAFEGHVTNFWMTELGVDECNSDNDGHLFATKNTYSSFYAANDSAYTEGDSSLVRLICDASGETPAWRFATEIEKDTAALSNELPEGAATTGKINTDRVYVKDGAWRRGTQLDINLDASCVTNVKNRTTFSVVSSDTTWYICADDGSKLDGYTVPISWRLATEAEADTAQFGVPETAKDSIKQGHINKGRYFVYDDGGWRRGTENDYLLGKVCLSIMHREVIKTAAGQFYTCTDETKLQFDGVAVDNTWRLSTADEADNYFGPDSDEGDVKRGDVDSSRVYVYENSKWRRGTSLDWILGEGCIFAKKGTVKKRGDNFYTCTNESTLENGAEVTNIWRLSNADEADTVGWTAPSGGSDSIRVGNIDKNRVYVYEDGVWRRGTSLDWTLGEGCLAAKVGTIKMQYNNFYTCTAEKTIENGTTVANTWRASTAGEADTYGWTAPTSRPDSVRTGNIDHSNYYVYKNKKWVKASNFEMDTYPLSATAAVGAYSAGSVNTNLHYVKDSDGWRPATDLENAGLGACTQTQKNNVKQSNGGTSDDWYKCVNEFTTYVDGYSVAYNWRKAKDIEKDTVGWGAYSYSTGDVKNGKINTSLTYVRQNSTWRHGTALDSIFKKAGYRACTTNNDTLKTYKYNNLYYVCTAQTTGDTVRKWVPAPDLFNDTYESRDSCKADGKYGDGTILAGRINKEKMYACQGANNFRSARVDEISYNRACVSFIENQIYKLNGAFRRCFANGGWSRVVDKAVSVMKAYGKEYKTVVIGTQQWMAENLNYAADDSYCYNGTASNCTKYGRLYEWMSALGACPAGWHLPTKAEWGMLFDAIGGKTHAGYMLKSASGWNSDGNGRDAYYFSAMPAGDRDIDSYGAHYGGIGNSAYFWTSTEDYNYDAYYIQFYYQDKDVYEDSIYKDFAISVRCVQD